MVINRKENIMADKQKDEKLKSEAENNKQEEKKSY